METVWSSGLGSWIWNLEVPCSNPTHLPLPVMVLGSPKFNPLDSVDKIMANWSVSFQLGFIIALHVYLSTSVILSTSATFKFQFWVHVIMSHHISPYEPPSLPKTNTKRKGSGNITGLRLKNYTCTQFCTSRRSNLNVPNSYKLNNPLSHT